MPSCRLPTHPSSAVAPSSSPARRPSPSPSWQGAADSDSCPRRVRVHAGHPVAGADGYVRLDGDDVGVSSGTAGTGGGTSSPPGRAGGAHRTCAPHPWGTPALRGRRAGPTRSPRPTRRAATVARVVAVARAAATCLRGRGRARRSQTDGAQVHLPWLVTEGPHPRGSAETAEVPSRLLVSDHPQSEGTSGSLPTREDDVDAHALHRRGWSISAIARHLEHDRRTPSAPTCTAAGSPGNAAVLCRTRSSPEPVGARNGLTESDLPIRRPG
jgi:hypothetical protein